MKAIRRAPVLVTWLLPALVIACVGAGATQDGIATLPPGDTPASDSTAGPTAASSGAPAGPEEQMLAYAQCMRDNGVANFPDPVNGGLSIDGNEVGIDTPVYKTADEACQSLLPPPPAQDPEQVQREREHMLAYAQCMRDNGVPNFPDPQPGGGINVSPESGVDPFSPAFKAAEEACASLPGAPGGPGTVTDSQPLPGSSGQP